MTGNVVTKKRTRLADDVLEATILVGEILRLGKDRKKRERCIEAAVSCDADLAKRRKLNQEDKT